MKKKGGETSLLLLFDKMREGAPQPTVIGVHAGLIKSVCEYERTQRIITITTTVNKCRTQEKKNPNECRFADATVRGSLQTRSRPRENTGGKS